MTTRLLLLTCLFHLALLAAHAQRPHLSAVSPNTKAELHAVRMHIGGRVLERGTKDAPAMRRQWPGTYFESTFNGSELYLKTGPGEAILKVLLDDQALPPVVKPAPGFYRVEGLRKAKHTVRLEVITESQSAPTEFDGFYLSKNEKGAAAPARAHQIEFIGDSHTVGYGNTSRTRDCTEQDVWNTTDTSQSTPPLVAQRYLADYQVNAISGRGIVRNYNGFAGDTLPEAYPFVLLNHDTRYSDANWHPQVIVIALGTNDFSTALHDGEKWKTRDDLHADFEKTYVAFLKQLRAHNKDAYFVLWATDMADGEILAEVQRVAAQARAAGEQRLTVVPMSGLEFTGCNFHPSLKDDEAIADALSKAIAVAVPEWKK